MRCLLVAATVLALAAGVRADTPVDYPCVTWISSNSNTPTPNPDELFVATNSYIRQYVDEPNSCFDMGKIIPCFANSPDMNTWGHHDWANDFPSDSCRTAFRNGTVTFANNFYLPKKGPKYKTWKWVSASKGGPVPERAIRFHDAVMARSTINPPGQCVGQGFTGWAEGLQNGTFGDVHFSIVNSPFSTETFEIAVCEAYHPTPEPPTPEPTTMAPPPTTFSPTLPPNNKPYIRFANTVPSANKITATIKQGSISYTWHDYGFGEFSKWVEVFAANVPGTLTLVSGGNTLLTTTVPLTPGPLVVAVKDMWPPVQPSNVETIAASYVPPASGSGARLFNLSPDTQSASMSSGGKTLVQDVIYADGSDWASVPVGAGSYTVSNFATGATIATDSFSAPPAPFVFTNFLIGLANSTDSSFKAKLVPLADAPEF